MKGKKILRGRDADQPVQGQGAGFSNQGRGSKSLSLSSVKPRAQKWLGLFLAFLMLLGNPSLWLGLALSTPFRIGLPVFISSLLLSSRVFASRLRPRAVQVTDLRGISLSDTPGDDELARVKAFEEPLLPTSPSMQGNENHDLASALRQALADTNGDLSSLGDFASSHPKSRWILSVELNRGLILYQRGYFSEAMDAFKTAWEAGNAAPGEAKLLADRALAEWMRMDSRVGRMDEMKTLLETMKNRRPIGKAAREYKDARDAMWVMQNRPGKAFFCGVYALKSILKFQKSKKADDALFQTAQSTNKGFSLQQVYDFSQQLGMGLQMAKRHPGAPFLFPSVVHWKLNHYAALVEEKHGLIHSQDPTFLNETWMSEKALDEEASGYFLVPEGTLPAGWEKVDADEASQVWGKGQVGGVVPESDCPICAGNGAPSGGVGGSPPPSCGAHGMPKADMDMDLVAAMLRDTPVGYQPAIGPSVFLNLTYHSETANQLLYTNFGSNWSFNWQGYINYSYSTSSDGAVVTSVYTLASPGGGQEAVSVLGIYSPYTQSLWTATGTFGSGSLSGLPSVITRLLPDGSSEVYSNTVVTEGVVTMFLTQVLDSKGNAVNLNYDTYNRLASLTDALGQTTTFIYNGTPGGFYPPVTSSSGGLIASAYAQVGTGPVEVSGGFPLCTGAGTSPLEPVQVTDPFGRSAYFQYNCDGFLISITDVLGLTSTMTYNPSSAISADWVGTLTTPYGTTTFDYEGTQETYGSNELEITDPLFQKEHARFYQGSALQPPDANNPVPAGALGSDPFILDRNTYFWNTNAMADDPLDPASAKIYHWLHSGTGLQSDVLECIKNPLESRIWYVYPTQTDPISESSDDMLNKPSVVTRFATGSGDSQVSQEYLYGYDAFGKVTSYTDPTGRQFSYTYDPTGIDRLCVKDQNHETLAKYTYNSQHEPLTDTDASGQVWNYSYNSAGQIQSMTSPLGETTSYTYDSQGRLVTMAPPQPGSTVSYTYDSVNRIATQTTAATGTVSFHYDNLDRKIQANYPDGTHESYGYTKLDLTSYTDRQGRTTAYGYDADRHLTSTLDPKQETTTYTWCNCGSLTGMTDPKGNKTQWPRDYEGRVKQKIYPDGTSTDYEYDPNQNLLVLVTDGNKQTTQYIYDLDNELVNVNYNNGPVTTPNVSLEYDPILPRLTQMTDGTGTSSYSYYPIGSTGGGHLQTVSQPIGTTAASIGYVYDADGRVTSQSIDGTPESYTYTSAELTNVTNPLGSFGYTYDSTTSKLTQVAYPNGQKANFDYFNPTDPLGSGRLKDITNLGAGTTSGQTLSKFSYTYNPSGDIKAWTQQLDNTPTDAKTYGMGYDANSELTSATLTNGTNGFDGLTTNQGVTFGYDAAGNRTQEQTPSYNHTFATNNDNQLTSITPKPIHVKGATDSPATIIVNGAAVTEDSTNQYQTDVTAASGTSTPVTIQSSWGDGTTKTDKNHLLNTQPYSYDQNGNLIQDNEKSYQWDAQNRLVQINFLSPKPAGVADTITMSYDGVGRRKGITELHGTTVITAKTFVWCGAGLCQERDGTGHTITKQFFSLGEQINGTNYFYTMDHLNNIREMTDSGGTVHSSYDYDTFGRQTKLSGDLDADFGYTGFYIEKTACLDLTLFRVYDAEKGRWLSRDPLEERTGLNLYAYVGNDPAGYIDPFGQEAWHAPLAWPPPSRTPSCPFTPTPSPAPSPTPTQAQQMLSLLNQFAQAWIKTSDPGKGGGSGNLKQLPNSNPMSDQLQNILDYNSTGGGPLYVPNAPTVTPSPTTCPTPTPKK